MRPRLSRGAGPPKGPQQPQQAPPQPLPQQQGALVTGPPSHLHNFHQHQPHQPQQPQQQHHQHQMAPPPQGGVGGSNGAYQQGGGGTNSTSNPGYNGGYGGPQGMQGGPAAPAHHHHHLPHGSQMPPPAQQQQQWGGVSNSTNTSMYGGGVAAPPMQHQQQQQHHHHHQQQPYGGDMGYGGGPHDSMPPPPQQQLQGHQSPYPPQQQQQQQQGGGRGGGGGGYGGPSSQSPPNGGGYRGGGPPVPPMGASAAVGGMDPSVSGYGCGGGYGGREGSNSPSPPASGYRAGGATPQRGGGGYPPPSHHTAAQQQQQQQMGGGMPPPPPPSGYSGNNSAPPQHHQHHQPGMYGGGGSVVAPPGHQHHQQQQQWGGGGPGSGYSSAPPPGPMSGVPLGGGGGIPPQMDPQQQQQQQVPMHPQQQQSMPQGRGRGGARGGRGGNNNQQQQQQPPPPPQGVAGAGMLPSPNHGGYPVGPGGYGGGPVVDPRMSAPSQQQQQQQAMMAPPLPQQQQQQQQQGPMPPQHGGMMPQHQHQHQNQHQHQHHQGGGGGGYLNYGGMGPIPNGGMPLLAPGGGGGGLGPMGLVDPNGMAMGVESNYFYTFLKDRHLLKAADLADFMPADHDVKAKGPVKVVVDGNYMVANLRDRMQRSDPLWFLHSVLPDMLLSLVNIEVGRMRAANLEPVWVFQGIGTNGDVEAFLPSKDELLARDDVWSKLTDGDVPTKEEITEAFDASSSIGTDALMAIQRFLSAELGVMAVTAPFLNWCQMAAFHHDGEAQLIIGPTEMLIVPYEPMRVIVEVDLDAGKVAFFDREEVVRNLFPHYVNGDDTRAAGDRLLDFGLLVASHSALSTCRALLRVPGSAIYEELSSPQPRYGSLADFICACEMPDANPREGAQTMKHSKGRSYVTCSPVFSKSVPDTPLPYFKRVVDGSLTNRNMPNNLSGVFGNFLPLSFFYFQFSGLLSVDMMIIVAQSYFRDEMPVSDSVDYQQFLPRLVALRSQTLHQIVQRLSSRQRQRLEKISWVRWFESVLVVVQTPTDTIELDEWDLHGSDEARHIRGLSLQEVTVDMVLSLRQSITCVHPDHTGTAAVVDLLAIVSAGASNSIKHNEITHSTTSRKNGASGAIPVYYNGVQESYFAVLLKTFDFLGYFSHHAPPGEEDEEGVEDGEEMLVQQQQHLAGGVLMDAQTGEAVDMGNNVNVNANNRSHNRNISNGGANMKMDLGDEEEERGGVGSVTGFLIRTLQCSPPEFHSALLRLTEMAGLGLLNALPCTYTVADKDSDEFSEAIDDEDAQEVLLATRIACLVSIPYLDTDFESSSHVFAWAPVYCRHLCTFSVMVRAMNRDLRELVEVIATTVSVSGHSDASLEDFAALVPFLPFNDVPSSISGLLLHYVLVFPSDYEENCCTPRDRCGHLQAKFTCIPDVPVQLRAVMTFVFHALFFLNAYRNTGEEGINLSLELLVPDPVMQPDAMDVIDETIKLMLDKWSEHLDGPPPTDMHGMWPLMQHSDR